MQEACLQVCCTHPDEDPSQGSVEQWGWVTGKVYQWLAVIYIQWQVLQDNFTYSSVLRTFLVEFFSIIRQLFFSCHLEIHVWSTTCSCNSTYAFERLTGEVSGMRQPSPSPQLQFPFPLVTNPKIETHWHLSEIGHSRTWSDHNFL